MLRADTPQGRNDTNATSVDLDTLTQQGTYDGINLTTTINGPTGTNYTNWRLDVSGPLGTVVTQVLYTQQGVYTRTGIPGTGWNAWTRGGTQKHAVVAGAAAGNFTVNGINTTDSLDSVLYYVGAGTSVTDVQDLTSQFSITAANTINNTGGTASTGGKLVVSYTKLS